MSLGEMSNLLTLNQVIHVHCCPLKSSEMQFFSSYLFVSLHSSSQGFLETLKRLCRWTFHSVEFLDWVKRRNETFFTPIINVINKLERFMQLLNLPYSVATTLICIFCDEPYEGVWIYSKLRVCNQLEILYSLRTINFLMHKAISQFLSSLEVTGNP
jgi:hypothetical protein